MYEAAPEAVSITGEFKQIALSFAETLIAGFPLTVIVVVALPEQPLASVPVAVYTVVAEGVTEIKGLVEPLFHKRELAPEASNNALFPSQTAIAPLITTVGVVYTIALTVVLLVHPLVFPLTVYVVLPVGVNCAEDELPPPSLQVYVEDP